MTLEDVRMREAIRYTLELYTRNVDTADYERHHDVFHPDGEMEVQGGALMKGAADIIAGMRAGAARRGAFDPGHFQRHHMTSVMIERTGEASAEGLIYVTVYTELGLDHIGGYRDQYCAVGDRWMIYRRKARMEWSRPDSRFTRWLGAPGQEDRL